METSILIAKILGPIYLIVGLGLLLNPDHIRRVAREITDSAAHFYMSGLFALIVGMIIVRFHNVWSGWPAVITLIGWLAVLKGALRLLFPERTAAQIGRIAASDRYPIWGGASALLLGGFLTAMGYGFIG